MPSSQGPQAYNVMLKQVEVEMAKEKGVFREKYETHDAFRAAREAAGITWPMVQEEGSRRSGKSTTADRNAAWDLVAMQEEANGVPMRTNLAKKEGGTYRDRYIHRKRLELQKGQIQKPASPEIPDELRKASAALAARRLARLSVKPVPVAVPVAVVTVPVAVVPVAVPVVPVPVAVVPVAVPVVPVVKAVPEVPVVKAVPVVPVVKAVKAPQDPKEVAEQAAWDKEYEEISLGGNTYLRHRQMGLIFVKGGVRELGDQMPEWDEDLGEFMAE